MIKYNLRGKKRGREGLNGSDNKLSEHIPIDIIVPKTKNAKIAKRPKKKMVKVPRSGNRMDFITNNEINYNDNGYIEDDYLSGISSSSFFNDSLNISSHNTEDDLADFIEHDMVNDTESNMTELIDDGDVVLDINGNVIQEDNTPYFDLDSKPIQTHIIDGLVKAGVNPNLAESTVKSGFSSASNILIKDYMGAEPADKRWKLGQELETISKLEPILKEIREAIKEETPTIPKILSSNITFVDKKRCIKFYDQLQNIEPYTPEHETKMEQINNIIRKGKRYTEEEVRELEQIENNLKEKALPPDNLKNQILTLDADEKTKAIIYGQYLDMMENEVGSQAYNAIKEEIEWSVRLPHQKSLSGIELSSLSNNELNEFYVEFMKIMDQELYGMVNIKYQMLHILNDRRSNESCGRNIAIVGEPGVGKTAIGEALAKTINMPSEKISVGGMKDASILTGSDRVWNSASPSIVLQILSRIKSSSGVVIIDELEKASKEVQYALLHITDYVHNKEFRDQYLNKYSHDFSKILFIFTLNSTKGLDPALLSRIDLLEALPYTDAEKKLILCNYVLPKYLKKINMNPQDIILDSKAVTKLINATRSDPGVREIEKVVKCLVGKVNMYRNAIRSDGSMGDLKLPYKIPSFKLPLKVSSKLLVELTKEKIKY